MSVATALVALAADSQWLDNPAIKEAFWPSVWQTLGMTAWATVITVVIGTPLGLFLVSTARGGLTPNRVANQILGFIVNVGRSIPFIILLIAVLPFTRFVVGTTLGWKAAVVPLSVGAIPFFARIVETNVRGVSAGKIEAAHMMGASRWEIMFGVQVREALPALIDSVTVLAVTLIGYSAIAGVLGGGGLGQLAMNYGYNRFQGDVMLVSVVGIVIIVQIVQVVGDMLSRLVDHR
ncbi:methionine ABC transporter permease [Actinomyces sp. S4-C9]|uniref:methionine ABC transporter permease n=1 Tax=Actinomyces sp. S4-C9 TaxID=1219581 RepID=UPI00050D9AD4|nr:methionine ABC transporter permease [Actinomyces sp. S4-C9]KGF01666.1 metal ABC transporter permease [Actinomyces sp. S4-C9]